MWFSRQEYWSGLTFPSPGDLPHPGIKSGSPALRTHLLSHQGRLFLVKWLSKILTCFSFLELVLGESVCFLHIESFYFNGYQSLSGVCFSNVFLILWLIHLFSNSVFWSTVIFNFYKVLFSTFFLIWVMLLLLNLRSLCLYKLCHNFLLFSSKRFIVLGFTFSLESILSLIFVYGVRYWLRLFFACLFHVQKISSVLFVEKTILSLLNCLCIFVEN